MKQISAGLIFCQDQILIAQRRRGKLQEYLWEFPGGKQEAGETLEECLKREIREELDKEIEVGEFFMSSIFAYESGEIELNAFFATMADKEIPAHPEHEKVKWVSLQELNDYTLSAADIPIKDALLKRFHPTLIAG